jgi:hypothetical protein
MPISSYELIKFPNRIFVETGSYIGDGIASALKSGFEEVYSVDISPYQYDYCTKKFEHDKRVHLYLDDCSIWLDKILNQINEQCTIYLDANGWIHEKEHPFNSSIEAIVRHGRKDHTILVDDMNHDFFPFEKVQKDLPTSNVGKQLLRINPEYSLYIIDSHSENMQHTYPAWIAVGEPIKKS